MSARNENARENRIKRKQARQLWAKSKIKNNKQGKFEPSQFTRKENSGDPRRNQAHWSKWNQQLSFDHSIPPNSVKQIFSSMTSKPEDICSKFPFNKITKCEGVIDYKIIHEIHRKIQANASTIQSELGGGQNGLLGLEMQPDTYRTVIRQDFQRPVRPPQAAPVPTNADAS